MEAGKTGAIKMPNNFDEESMDVITGKCMRVCNQAAADYNSKVYKKKIYFAGPWFDERAAVLYSCCQNIERAIKLRNKYSIYYPKEEVNNTPHDAFLKNVTHIHDCDVVVALVSRKDVGTAWEIGMAYALGKPVYLLGYDRSTFLSHTNVMLAFTGKCFTIDKYAKFLVEGLTESEFVKIDNEWEGIE